VEVRARDDAVPFVTTDGSTIRSLLDRSNAPVAHQSLAEATIGAGESTVRHHHRVSEEIYYLVEGRGTMELDDDVREVAAGDAVLIPPGAWHRITASPDGPLRLLCGCAPPWSADDTYLEDDAG
jgi:mannose-6-phosphate isomerase-like protein (cupin superfamily)